MTKSAFNFRWTPPHDEIQPMRERKKALAMFQWSESHPSVHCFSNDFHITATQPLQSTTATNGCNPLTQEDDLTSLGVHDISINSRRIIPHSSLSSIPIPIRIIITLPNSNQTLSPTFPLATNQRWLGTHREIITLFRSLCRKEE